MTGTPSVGFIGLGSMGGRIVRLLSKGGFDLTLWARRPEATQPFLQLPTVHLVGSPAEVAARSQILALCVWGEPDVESVIDAAIGKMKPGSVVIVHSTVSAGFCIGLADRLAARGVAVVDAPVSVRFDRERLLVMAGGDRDVLMTCEPLLKAIGDPVVYFGGVGGGQRAMLINNVLLAAQVALAGEALSVGKDFGLAAEDLTTVLTYGSSATMPGIRMLSTLHESAVSDRSARQWAAKDVALMRAELKRAGVTRELSLLSLGDAGATIVSG